MTGQAAAPAARQLLIRAASTASVLAERAGVQVRPLETLDHIRVACTVLNQVWQIGPGQPSEIQPQLLRALGHGGNHLVGAYGPDGAALGASVSFFTEPLGTAMHSHITGVLPAAAGRGVGAALKWHQRQWALERGLHRITWTFDPLIARNAFFNLTVLGARPETYFVDFYGPMDDGPNRGQPTDRLQVGWDLGTATTLQAASDAENDRKPDGPRVDTPPGPDTAIMLSVGGDGSPVPGRSPRPDDRVALIAIPRDVEAMRRTDPACALSWRHELRAALALLMADPGWRVTGFARSGWYRLERSRPATALPHNGMGAGG